MSNEKQYGIIITEVMVFFMVGLTVVLMIASLFDVSFPYPPVETLLHSIRGGLIKGCIYAAEILPQFAVFGSLVIVGYSTKKMLITILQKLAPITKSVISLIKNEMEKPENEST